jgi:hypothetical protein
MDMNGIDLLVIAERLRAAVAALAQVCDGAKKRDDVGFSASDTSYGRAIAGTPAEQWTRQDCIAVSALLGHYRGQLTAYGVDWAGLPNVTAEPVDRDRSFKAFKERATEAARQQQRMDYVDGRITREQVRVSAPYLAWIEKRTVCIESPRDEALIAAIKACPNGRRWNGLARRWEAELSPANAKALLAIFSRFNFLVSAADQAVLAQAQVVTAAAKVERPQADHVAIEGDRIVLRIPYNPEATTALKDALPGRRWDAANKVWTAPATAEAAKAVEALAARFGWRLGASAKPLWAMRVEADRFRAASKASDAEIELKGLANGAVPYSYQKAGVVYAGAKRRVLIADEMGCISGDAGLTCNRASKGFKITLRDLYRKFNGITGKWRKGISTRTRSLVDGEIRLNDIVAVLYKGEQRVLRVRLASGKALVCTPDHEIATGLEAWTRADALMVGCVVLTNGIAACRLCGSTTGVSEYKYAKFPGVCRKCMYRKMRRSRSNKGSMVDCDGYVRVSGCQDHPRANRSGQVYEHILVMEDHLGRAIGCDEQVHHVNGDPSDNRIENLRVLSRSEHFVEHHRHCNLDGGIRRGVAVVFLPVEDRVVAIEEAGTTDVYDLVMADPARNFVADGMIVHNCGKTPQALITVAQLDAWPCLVVVPKAVLRQWARETTKFLEGRTASIIGLKGTAKRLAKHGLVAGMGGDVVVINYDILGRHLDALRAHGFRSLVVDEGHYIKSRKTARFKAVKELSGMPGLACTLLLTGTPVLNRPIELVAQLDVLGQLDSFGGFMPFAKRYWVRP